MGLLMRRQSDRSDKLSAARRGNHANRAALLLSLLFGAVATVATFTYLSNQKTGSAGATSASVVLVPEVVAVQDIPARTTISAGMVRIEQVPADLLHPQAFAQLDAVLEQITRYPIAAGEPLLQSKLAEPGSGLGLTGLIPVDKRAVSIEVNDVSASAGLINPGDSVDVIAAFEVEEAGINKSVTVLQDVLVLAVARQLSDGQVAAQEGASGDPLAAGRTTVTLALSAEEAERLLMSDVKGTLRLALRRVGDTGVTPLPGALLDEITGASTSPVPTPGQ